MKYILIIIVAVILYVIIWRPDVMVLGFAEPRKVEATSKIKFKQEILPAPETRKATVIDVQPTAVKEVLQNTARP